MASGDTGRGHANHALPVSRGRMVTILLHLDDAFELLGDTKRSSFVWTGDIHKVRAGAHLV